MRDEGALSVTTLISAPWLLLVLILHDAPPPPGPQLHASLRCYAIDRPVDAEALAALERQRNLALMMTPTPAERAARLALDRDIEQGRHQRSARRQ